jgi:hypothetical protein
MRHTVTAGKMTAEMKQSAAYFITFRRARLFPFFLSAVHP